MTHDDVARSDIVEVGGPWFEDLSHGQVIDDAPAVTLTDGHAAMHQAVVGDRLRLPLDQGLSQAVIGSTRPLAHPSLVCDIAIGQSTLLTERVKANLFYRGLILRRPVCIGDTLHTRTEVVALKQNRAGSGTGLAVLRMRTLDQHDRTVLDFWRCPMVPLRDPATETGHHDTFDDIPDALDIKAIADGIPGTWDLTAFRGRVAGGHSDAVVPGQTMNVSGRDTVSAATQLVRLSLNLATVHRDPHGSHGRRLVYGGHTIGVAAAHVSRALPNMVTTLAWRSCTHTGPVFEGDLLSTTVQVQAAHPIPGGGSVVELRAFVSATRDAELAPVLDWELLALFA